MCWLYVPGSPASNSASALPCPERGASLTLRGKPMPPRLLLRAWAMGHSVRLLSGLTLPPSTLDRCAASWIASLRATRASPTARSAETLGPTTTGSSSIRSCGSRTSAGLVVSSARTSQGTPTDSFTPSSLLWSGWATALRLEYSARPKSARPTTGSGSSLWPTPLARDYKDGTAEVVRDGKVKKDTLGRALGGPPNPPWVEWLMGLPAGWTDNTSSVTELSRWSRLMLGALSKLGSTARSDQGSLL
jgi:hypothetical protein